MLAGHGADAVEGLVVEGFGGEWGWSAVHGRQIELGELVLADSICGVDEDGRVPEDSRAIEDEPGDGEPEEEGDVDGLTEPGPGTLIFDGVEKSDELVFLEFAVAVGTNADWWKRCLVRDERDRRVWIGRNGLDFRLWLGGGLSGIGWRGRQGHCVLSL